VRRVLVEQHQPTVGFEDDVKARDDADETKGDFEERDGIGGRRDA